MRTLHSPHSLVIALIACSRALKSFRSRHPPCVMREPACRDAALYVSAFLCAFLAQLLAAQLRNRSQADVVEKQFLRSRRVGSQLPAGPLGSQRSALIIKICAVQHLSATRKYGVDYERRKQKIILKCITFHRRNHAKKVNIFSLTRSEDKKIRVECECGP